MAQSKYPSFKMPLAGLSGFTLGGGAWVQKNFNLNSPSTWDGIVIDPDGSFFNNSSHIGLTVWSAGTKNVQLNSSGLLLKGGASAWVPAGYDAGNPSTWNGVVINSTGIWAYLAGTQTVNIDTTGSFVFGSVENKRILFNSATGKLTIERLASLFDADGVERVAGDVFRGGYRASLKLTSTGKISFDDVDDSATYVKSTLKSGADRANAAINSSNQIVGAILGTTTIDGVAASTVKANAATGAGLTADNIPDGTTYKKLTATKLSEHDTAFTRSASLDAIPDGTTYVKSTLKSGADRANAAINSSNQIVGAILGTTTIDGVAASTVKANAATGAGLTADNIPDGTTYKKLTAAKLGYHDAAYSYCSSWKSDSGNISADKLDDGTTYGRVSLTQRANYGTAYTHSQATGNPHGATFANFSGYINTTGISSSGGISCTGSVTPTSKNAYYLGVSKTSNWWAAAYIGYIACNDIEFRNFYQYGYNILSDGWDDLELLDKIDYEYDKDGKPRLNERGESVVEILSFPDHVTTIDLVARKRNVTIESIKASKDKKIKEEIAIRGDSMRGLQIGAIRQLNKKVNNLIEEFSAWKSTLTT